MDAGPNPPLDALKAELTSIRTTLMAVGIRAGGPGQRRPKPTDQEMDELWASTQRAFEALAALDSEVVAEPAIAPAMT